MFAFEWWIIWILLTLVGVDVVCLSKVYLKVSGIKQRKNKMKDKMIIWIRIKYNFEKIIDFWRKFNIFAGH